MQRKPGTRPRWPPTPGDRRPLLDETIGANLARPSPPRIRRGAGRPPPGRALDLRRVRRAGRPAGPRPARARPRAGRPGRAVEPELRRVDAAAVRHGRDRRDPRQRQPGVPHPRAGLRPQPVGLPDAVRRPVVQDVRLRGHGRAGPTGRSRRWSGRCSSGRTTGTSSSPAPTGERRRARGPEGLAVAGRPDQHPVHVGHHRLPEGATLTHRNILNNGYFVTRLQGFTSPPTGCASRCPSTTASAW